MSALAVEALRTLDGSNGGEDSAAFESAIRAYLEDKGRGSQGWRYPDFLRETEPGDRVDVELSLDSELWDAVEREAVAQEIAPERLLDQAVFYRAAELERGQAIGQALEKEQQGDEREPDAR